MYKILIVEDDLIIANSIARHLKMWDYQAEYITDFKDIIAVFKKFAPQLVLMDISLPFMNGYHWCSEIRKLSKVPILFLSSAADNMNIVMAMNMGADDFISKPFDLDVLCAKLGAMLRRAYSFGGSLQFIEASQVLLNLNDATLSFGEHKIALTKNDFKIIQVLMENAGRVVSRDTLMLRLWENDEFIDDNTLTVNMARLRKKLEGIGLSRFITTKKGMGYMVE